jgi:hypothetical protein
MPDVTTLEAALQPVASALEADGYLLHARQDDGGVQIEIAAGPDACEDCLVPKSLMSRMIETTLTAAGISAPLVDLRYPADR